MIEMEERINKVLKVLEDIYKKNIEVKFKTLKNKNRNDCLINILLITLSQNEKKMLEDLFYYLETKDIESAENFDNKSKEFINKVISSGILTEKEQRKVLSSDSKCYIVMMEGDYNYVKDYSGHFGEGFTIYYNRFLEYEDFEKEVKMDSEGVLRVRKYKYGLLTCKNVKKILDILTNN